MYEYKCTVIRIIDGDSAVISVDLGFRISMEMRFRLTGINAPELKTDAGKAAKQRLLELMPIGSEMIVRTKKDRQEKYGRYLGLFIDSEGHEVNERMVMEGFATRYME
jgi:micrococcal nuclease